MQDFWTSRPDWRWRLKPTDVCWTEKWGKKSLLRNGAKLFFWLMALESMGLSQIGCKCSLVRLNLVQPTMRLKYWVRASQ